MILPKLSETFQQQTSREKQIKLILLTRLTIKMVFFASIFQLISLTNSVKVSSFDYQCLKVFKSN